MLKIEHLTKTYGDKKAVDDLTLHIRPGEIYGFIGHNGAGKSTTLKSVAGILQFDAGTITIDGKIILKRSPGLQAESGLHPGQPGSVRVHERHQVSELHRGHLRHPRRAATGADPEIRRSLS